MKRVLVVDDQPNIHKLIRLSLASTHEVFETSSTVEAMEMNLQRHFDLVIFDVMMPGVYNGLHVLEWIRLSKNFSYLPVIMVTAMGQEVVVAPGNKLGATAYLIKPSRPMDLSHRVDGMR